MNFAQAFLPSILSSSSFYPVLILPARPRRILPILFFLIIPAHPCLLKVFDDALPLEIPLDRICHLLWVIRNLNHVKVRC